MSKLRCLCGHQIIDQTDYLPYKAYFITDEDEEDVFQLTVSAIEKFILACEQDRLEEVFGQGFLEVYPKDSGLKDFLHDTLAAGYFGSSRDLYECEQCGRIWIQSRDKSGQFFPYKPEEDERGILRSIHKDTENREAKNLLDNPPKTRYSIPNTNAYMTLNGRSRRNTP